MMVNKLTLVVIIVAASVMTRAQQIIPLYTDSMPNSTGYKMVEQPVKYGNTVIGVRNISEPLKAKKTS